jgi:hypothetical protein
MQGQQDNKMHEAKKRLIGGRIRGNQSLCAARRESANRNLTWPSRVASTMDLEIHKGPTKARQHHPKSRTGKLKS